MSAWGITNFENDIALDFVTSLVEERKEFSISSYTDVFKAKFNPDETTLDECMELLVVAELLAALLGEPSEDIPIEMKTWIEGKYIKIESELTNAMIDLVKLLIKDSEIKEMYCDTPYYKVWTESQTNLLKRLKS